jgi:ketosteroid isomerase-like protein
MTATSSAPEVVAGKQLVHDFLTAMNRMDVAAIGALLTDDATWTMPGDLPVSGRHEGRDAVLGDFLAKAAALFEPGSLRFELEMVLAEGHHAVAEYTGTGLAADGLREYRNHYCMVFECRDGRISAVREYLDTAHVRDALL